MSFLGSNKESHNATSIDNSQTDAKVSASGSQVLSASSKAKLTYTDQHGQIRTGANSVINFGADSNDLHQAVQDAAANANASNLGSVLGALGGASAPSSAAPATSHTKLYVGVGVALAVLVVAGVFIAKRR